MQAPTTWTRAVAIVEELGGWAGRAVIEQGALPSAPGTSGLAATEGGGPLRLRQALERLGPVFIKLGQLLSTRPDLVPPDYMRALQGLQSRVAPMSPAEVDRVLAAHAIEVGGDPFAELDPTPVAAASLAQVHRARLRDGSEVAVKIRRAGVAELVATDLRVLALLAKLGQRVADDSGVYDFPGTVEEVTRTILDEIDFRNEAESLVVFGRNLAAWSDAIVIPAPREELTTESVLVMDFVRGRTLGDSGAAGLTRARREELASALAHAYFSMFFIDGTFHADPHPGNLVVTDDERLALLDFGMVGRIERQVGDNLVRVLLSFLLKDAHGVAHAFLDLGKPTAAADENGWIMEVRRLVPRYHGTRLERLNVGTLLVDLLRSSARNGIQSPPVVALVCKSLANMDGSARLLDPSADVVGLFQSFVPKLLEAEAQRVGSVEEIAKLALDTRIGAQRIPSQIATILEKAATGRLRLVVDSLGSERASARLGRAADRMALAQLASGWMMARAARDGGRDEVDHVGRIERALTALSDRLATLERR